MLARNWLCCLAATFAFLFPTTSAQEAGDPPSPAEAMAAYRAVDNWVREWRVSQQSATDPKQIQPDANQPAQASLPACQAASITLRLAGEIIARGVAIATDDTSRATVISRATAAALKEAEPKLSIPRDAMYETTRREVAKSITISMQLAGALIPIQPKDAAEAMTMVNPGVEGVGARLGDRIDVMFPERMLVAGAEPGSALGTLAGKLADDVTLAVEPLSKLSKDHGAVFYRFRVTHLAQTNSWSAPGFLSRCGRVVRLQEMDAPALKGWADELAGSLGRSAGAWSPWMTCSYDPIRGKLIDGTQDDAQVLLAALALARYARMPQFEARRREEADIDSHALVVKVLTPLNGPERKLIDPLCCAIFHLWTVSGVPLRETKPDYPTVERNMEPARAVVLERSVAIDTKEIPATFGLIAAAMAEGLGTEFQAKESVRRAMQRVPTGALPSAMPWLGWAELKCHPSERGDVPSATALRDMRAQLWKHQLKPDDLAPDQQDMAGGIVFTTTKVPMPTWQMARPLAFVATMLGDPRLTEENEVSEELLRLLASLRFLRQLTASEAEGFMYRFPDRMIGGVRSSLWDQRMPPEATAMTLLTVCETLRSLDEIRKRQEAK